MPLDLGLFLRLVVGCFISFGEGGGHTRRNQAIAAAKRGSVANMREVLDEDSLVTTMVCRTNTPTLLVPHGPRY